MCVLNAFVCSMRACAQCVCVCVCAVVASEVDRFVSLLTTCLAALPQDATLYGVEVRTLT